MFPCTACGQCCKNVHKSEQTKFLDRGDGICHHFNESTLLCAIYEDRPLVCRIEDYYKANLIDIYEWEEFVELNLQVCDELNQELNSKKDAIEK
ncbi:YkgJ family cysteine cluster protein [uncultured Psychrobacter sp.]|uniref:YkgJ family cysteine cluster protein n=1 Tax=uncultured Psychrobacter sp. TaxID=259303 RepID=UPI003457DCB5